ncbi:unnamed protein product [Adineta steineri]|uniref:Uncharacterized protein n=1 Tax=Adineta steineri TaxID=433720 RepID=A0A819DN06_9BILA|nr:unnamed protein product [Adineta steineri]
MWWSKAKYRSRSLIIFTFLFFTLKISTIDAARRIKLCPVMELPKHSFFFSGYCKHTPGSLCGLGCLTGYRLVNGDSFRECRQDGTWTGRQPKCEEIRCPQLKVHSRIIQECLPKQNNTQLRFGTQCQVKCNDTGYRLIGPRIRECLSMGRWTGYEQFCIAGPETTTHLSTSSTSTYTTTTTPKYLDYSNYALKINNNDTGIILTPFNSFKFTIIFWFYLENNTKTNLISLKEKNDRILFAIVIQQGRLVIHHTLRNQTKSTITTSINIPIEKWKHFTWTYSNKNQQSNLYIDGAHVTKLILFHQLFNGLITRIEIWKEIISEQQLLVSYRDCRKQNGDIFTWSQVSNQISIDTSKLKSSSFCSGCSEPASIQGGIYRVSDYEVGSSVEYECDYGYEMIGASRAFCMVPSEWYPLPPICKYNPCTTDCELCDKKVGVCLRQLQTILDPLVCDPPCDEDEVCIDGQCTWSNIDIDKQDDQCNPPCPSETQCINQHCIPFSTSHCPVICRHGQVYVDGRCGCYKGLCENDRPCYEICEMGERCRNLSCSCGSRGKCGKGEICQSDICMCGIKRDGCHPHEQCINGRCICKTSSCDQCNNSCKSNEICLDGKCVCTNQCQNAFCPFPCLHGGRCTGFYRCTCRQGWQGHRCERRNSIIEK